MLFDVGNLITLGIVVLVLILFRLMDRGNRSLDKVRKYTDRCKEDIASYIEEKSAAIKNYGIALEVERKSASELLRRIQILTREELARKVEAISEIDERIRDYDASLEELVQMTGRVQENLNRIHDESAYVESVGKRVTESMEKTEQIENVIESLNKKLQDIELTFEQENAEAMEKIAGEAFSNVRTTVLDMEASAQTIERKVEEHREAIDKMERGRENRLARDEERIERLLAEAIDRAGSRADKVEETALAKLRDQAHDRLNRIKANFEEKVKSGQDNVKSKVGEIQDQLKSNREEWKAEAAAIEAQQKANSAEWKKDSQEFTAFAKQQKDEWKKDVQEFTAAVNQQAEEINKALVKQREEWEAMSRDTGQNIITAAQERLDAYRHAQEEQFRQLSSITNDAAMLEEELKSSMQEAINRVNADFARCIEEVRGTWETHSAEYKGHLHELREELAGVDKELTKQKEKAFENVSKKLKGFEDEFLANLSKRSGEIDMQLAAWQEAMDKRLESIAEEAEHNRQKTEARFTDDLKNIIAAQSEKTAQDLEQLKTEAEAFEKGIREEIRLAEGSQKSFSEQLEHGLAEALQTAKDELNAKIGEHSLSVTETLRQSQRELETQIHNLSAETKERIAVVKSSAEDSHRGIEEWQSQHNARMKELDNSIEEMRRSSHDLAAENNERIKTAHASMDEIRKEIAAQAKLFDRTNLLKVELDHYVEDMSGNINKFSQLKNEIARFETQVTEIKRLEDDVNAKMTRFLSEKRRIEVMENDFNRLLQTSQLVEEKLAQVSNSDDILQTMQLQIRRLDDVIKETDEKYQRMEKKSKILQETNEGVDRNFKALQADEQSVERLKETIGSLKFDVDTIQNSVQALAAENEKAKDAAEKLSILDETVALLERRIAEMNVARESLARMNTEMEKLDKDIQTQLKLTRSLLDREAGKTAARAGKAPDEGAPPPRDRENVIRLKRQGWTIDEIARSLKMAKGEVELILEIGSKDM
jgi:DNA repair exonuclease SbcCD ATPase subunit